MDKHDEMSRQAGVEAAQTIAIAALIDLLIGKGVIRIDDVVERYSGLSDQIIREGFADRVFPYLAISYACGQFAADSAAFAV